MKSIRLQILIVLLITNSAFAQPKTFDITAYGALGDGHTLNTMSIQKAIDAAALKNGGKVLVPAGNFVTGTFELRSGIELHLAKGAVLSGSIKRSDYEGFSPLALIFAKHQNNISITGDGVIDGRGGELVQDIIKQLEQVALNDPSLKGKRPREANRPYILYFEECNAMKVKGITLKNAATWVQNYNGCSNLLIDSIRVESTAYWNNDGIDIVDCKDVKISNCYINASDDAICLKSERRDRLCENVYVENCMLRSSANAFKLGTACFGGFKNIAAKNLTVFDTYRSAIAIEAVDGGVIDNIDVRNITATNTGNAILIRLGHRNKDTVNSQLRNVHIANVKVEVPKGKPDKGYPIEGPLLKYPPGFSKPPAGIVESVSPWNHSSVDSTAIVYEHNVFPSSITGLPGNLVENVVLENIEIIYEGGASKEKAYFPLDSLHIITEAITAYPEFSMFGELPAWGFFVRHVNGISMKNVTLRYKESDFRTPMIFDDVKNLQLENIKIPAAVSPPVIVLNNVADPVIKEVSMPYELNTGIWTQMK